MQKVKEGEKEDIAGKKTKSMYWHPPRLLNPIIDKTHNTLPNLSHKSDDEKPTPINLTPSALFFFSPTVQNRVRAKQMQINEKQKPVTQGKKERKTPEIVLQTLICQTPHTGITHATTPAPTVSDIRHTPQAKQNEERKLGGNCTKYYQTLRPFREEKEKEVKTSIERKNQGKGYDKKRSR